MGQRGIRANSPDNRRSRNEGVPRYSGPHLWDLLIGPIDESDEHHETLRAEWEIAREALMHPQSHFRRYGWRPWGYWQFDVGVDLVCESGAQTQPEAILKLGLCRRGERAAIKRGEAA